MPMPCCEFQGKFSRTEFLDICQERCEGLISLWLQVQIVLVTDVPEHWGRNLPFRGEGALSLSVKLQKEMLKE